MKKKNLTVQEAGRLGGLAAAGAGGKARAAKMTPEERKAAARKAARARWAKRVEKRKD
jgi:hypothetical protein